MATTAERSAKTVSRMMIDLPPEIQMAIRLTAVREQSTTGDVVTRAIVASLKAAVDEARTILAARKRAKT